MCGLIFSSDPRGHEPAINALRTLEHRGPDDQGIYRDPRSGATLGHRRLSIIDPDGGAQPLVDRTEGAALVANGMIYNHGALREQLAGGQGDGFETASDSEVILRGYMAHGPQVAAQLDGMFAYVISDGPAVSAARDPIGIKPLYVGRSPGGLVLASEIKALLPVARDIEEFPPGHFIDRDGNVTPYYTLPRTPPTVHDPAEAISLIREVLGQTVRKRLQSDVPLGAFLSGGLDSSIIAALAIREAGTLKTFSVGLEGSPDVEAARRVARHIGSDHAELILTEQAVKEALPRILYHLESFDRDLVRSAVPCWFVSELASRDVKVVLTGEGADELFAGYDYYKSYGPTDALQHELRRSVSTMHNINLQRVDRMTMAHGLEARVPFLDTDMIELAAQLSPDLKLHRAHDGLVEKWILRKAFEDLLPRDIVWRDKEQFDHGSGTAALLQALAARATRPDFRSHSCAEGKIGRSAEEEGYRTHCSPPLSTSPDSSSQIWWRTGPTDRAPNEAHIRLSNSPDWRSFVTSESRSFAASTTSTTSTTAPTRVRTSRRCVRSTTASTARRSRSSPALQSSWRFGGTCAGSRWWMFAPGTASTPPCCVTTSVSTGSMTYMTRMPCRQPPIWRHSSRATSTSSHLGGSSGRPSTRSSASIQPPMRCATRKTSA